MHPEEEWERASSVSGHPEQAQSAHGHHSISPPPFFNMPISPFPMSYGLPPAQQLFMPPYGMPFPGYPPNFAMPAPGFPSSPGGGGMYSYGGGAQSVFGGEFGPPPLMPSMRPQASSKTHPSRVSSQPFQIDREQPRRPENSRRKSSDHHIFSENGRSKLPTSGSQPSGLSRPPLTAPGLSPPRGRPAERGSQSPPSSWRKSGDWVEQLGKTASSGDGGITTQSVKTRPKTQFAS